MEPQFKSSFIPKKDVVVGTHGGPQISVSTKRGLIDRLASLLFILVLIGWGALFGYQKYVEASITQVEREILAAQDTIDNAKIDQFLAFGKQVDIAKQLLDNHIIVEPLFLFMNTHTIPSVQFSSFSFQLVDAGLMITATANTKNFAAVALQERLLADSTDISNVAVSAVAIDSVTDKVTFKLSFLMPRTHVLYSEFIKSVVLPPTPVQNTGSTSADTNTDTASSDQNVDEFFNELFNNIDTVTPTP